MHTSALQHIVIEIRLDALQFIRVLVSDVNKIQEGIGDKIGNFFQWFSSFVAGIIIGLVYGWKLALVILSVSPLLMACGGFMTYVSLSFFVAELYAGYFF
jgi:hypothetical protein